MADRYIYRCIYRTVFNYSPCYRKSFHGSVLRIDVTGAQDFTDGDSGMAKAYRVPDDNPFVNDVNASNEIFAYGFRNMWGCSQDSKEKGGKRSFYHAETQLRLIVC